MSCRAILVVALALICGASAAVGVSRMLYELGTPVVGPETEPILVAAVDMPRGHTITLADVRIGAAPQGTLPKGALVRPEEATDRATLIPLVAGEAVLDGKLAAKHAGKGLAALVPLGMRAYTIQASRAASSVGGFILPGNKVDVLLNLRGNAGDDAGGGSTTTLLQSIEILAVDQRLDAPADNKVNPHELSSVTLLVTPDQVALLDLGQNLGQLTLALRNSQDDDQPSTAPATLADVQFRQQKPKREQTTLRPILPDLPSPPQVGAGGPQEEEAETRGIITLRGTQRGYVPVTPRR